MNSISHVMILQNFKKFESDPPKIIGIILFKWIGMFVMFIIFENYLGETNNKTKNFTMDLAYIEENDIFYFIEPNPFGSNYAAGSSLFHWEIDKVLYNNDGIIEFRYT